MQVGYWLSFIGAALVALTGLIAVRASLEPGRVAKTESMPRREAA